MMKSTVVRTLNKPPMAKKEKHLEVTAKEEAKVDIKQNGDSKTSKKKEKTGTVTFSDQQVNPLALKEKRKEIEMRLAYEADASSRENLNKIYNQHVKKEENFNNKVKGLLSDHEAKLKERIQRRKMKTSTYRSRPEDTSDTFPVDENNNNVKK
jgi:hypothetical protein